MEKSITERKPTYIVIDDMDSGKYIAHTEDDCHDDIDRRVFKFAMETGDVVSMGCISGIPVWKN